MNKIDKMIGNIIGKKIKIDRTSRKIKTDRTSRNAENPEYTGRCKYCGQFLKIHKGGGPYYPEWGTCQNKNCTYLLSKGKPFWDSTHI